MSVYGFTFLLIAVVAVSSQAAAKVCAGCPVKQDPSGFPINKLSRALATANFGEGVHKIISVTTQVVAGTKYTVVYESSSGKHCTASWVEAGWESKMPLATKVSCKATRSLLGGFFDVDDSEMPVVEGLGELASNQNNQNGENRKMVVKILKAQKQIVNGVNYKFKYLVKNTACTMNEVPTKECSDKEISPREVCESLVYRSNYIVHDSPQVQVIHSECHAADDITSFLAVPGGLVDGEDSAEMHEAAAYAAEYVNKKVNSVHNYGLYKINQVKQQVISGTLYHFNVLMRVTSCPKTNSVTLDNCPFAAEPVEKDIECDIKVWVKPWIGFKQVTESNCHTL